MLRRDPHLAFGSFCVLGGGLAAGGGGGGSGGGGPLDAEKRLLSSGLDLLISDSLVGSSDLRLGPGLCAWFTAPPVGFSAAIFGFGAPSAGPWPCVLSFRVVQVRRVLGAEKSSCSSGLGLLISAARCVVSATRVFAPASCAWFQCVACLFQCPD